MDGKDGEGAGPGGRTGTLQGDLCWLPAGHHEPTLLALAPCLCSLSGGKALPGLLRVSSQAASFLGCRWPPLLAPQDSWALCLHLPSAGRASCGPGGGGHWLRCAGWLGPGLVSDLRALSASPAVCFSEALLTGTPLEDRPRGSLLVLRSCWRRAAHPPRKPQDRGGGRVPWSCRGS